MYSQDSSLIKVLCHKATIISLIKSLGGLVNEVLVGLSVAQKKKESSTASEKETLLSHFLLLLNPVLQSYQSDASLFSILSAITK